MYPALYKKLTHIITYLWGKLKLPDERQGGKGRPRKITDRHAAILALYQHQSTRSTKKSLYDDFKATLHCSYKTLVVAMNRVSVLVLAILTALMRLNRKDAHVLKYTDATDIPVCLAKNGRDHRTMRGLADWGHSAKGWFYGVKLTMTRDDDGRILALRFTGPTENDREIFRTVNKEITGVIVADAGYVSKQLEKDMNVEGKRWILIRPLKSMKKLATAWQLRLYERRWKIEFDFRNLKLFHGLVTSLPRSVNGYLAHYLSALLSFVLA